MREQEKELNELEREVDELERDRQHRAQYDSRGLDQIKLERERYTQDNTELERKIKDMEKEKNNASTFHSTNLSGVRGKMEERRKEYEKLLKQKANQGVEDEEETQMKNEEGSEEGQAKVETCRAVRHMQVEGAARQMNRRLRLKRVRMESALEHLLNVPVEEREVPANGVSISVLENNLRREPFCLQRKDQRLVARYLVEDNSIENIEFDLRRVQMKVIVGSIFKTLITPYQVMEVEDIKRVFKKLNDRMEKFGGYLVQGLLGKDKKESYNSQTLQDKLEKIAGETLQLGNDSEAVEMLIIHAIERSENQEDIRVEGIVKMFSAAEFTQLYGKKGGVVILGGRRVDSHVDSGRKKTGNTVKGGEEDEKSIGKVEGIMERYIVGEEEEEESESGSGREEGDESEGPPPKFEVVEITSFNDPTVKEKILSMAEIKATGQVKGAIGNLLFGSKKTGGTEQGGEKKKLDFIFGKQNTSGQEEVKQPIESTEKKDDKPSRPKNHGFQINFNNVDTYNDEETLRKAKEEKMLQQKEKERKEKEEMEKRRKMQQERNQQQKPQPSIPDKMTADFQENNKEKKDQPKHEVMKEEADFFKEPDSPKIPPKKPAEMNPEDLISKKDDKSGEPKEKPAFSFEETKQIENPKKDTEKQPELNDLKKDSGMEEDDEDSEIDRMLQANNNDEF